MKEAAKSTCNSIPLRGKYALHFLQRFIWGGMRYQASRFVKVPFVCGGFVCEAYGTSPGRGEKVRESFCSLQSEQNETKAKHELGSVIY